MKPNEDPANPDVSSDRNMTVGDNNGDNRAANAPAAEEPVAYDREGRPLFLHPTVSSQDPKDIYASESPQIAQAQYVHIARPLEPARVIVPDNIQELHEKSSKQYPQLNLSDGEYIIASVTRHPIGIFQIWATAGIFIAAMVAVLMGIVSGATSSSSTSSMTTLGTLGIATMSILVVVVALISTYIYRNNRFYLTNESVIQEIQVGILNKREQTISLLNVEDASYTQQGILPYIFHYGAIRLSTEGEESTYRFNYVANPKETISTLNDAVEAFKNGRPVELSQRK